jgi:hypothetical protein
LDLVSLWQRLSLQYPFIWVVFAFLALLPSLNLISEVEFFEARSNVLPKTTQEDNSFISFDLGKSYQPFSPSFDEALGQLEWSYDPVRPDWVEEKKLLTLRMKGSKELKKIKIPERIFVAFDEAGVLRTENLLENFWIDIKDSHFQFGAKAASGEIAQSDMMPIFLQELSARPFHEAAESSAFRALTDARFLGTDQFLLSLDPLNEVQRIEFGVKDKGEVLNLKKSDWLIFDQGSWKAGSLIDVKPDVPILRWVQKYGQYLELEGWDRDGSYHRFRWDLSPSSFVKKDDLFAQLKIRSEKQISCTIDQQYLILKPGDWALKVDQRWKVLRKKDEKDAFLQGQLIGELLFLERIEMKNGMKRAVGRLFSPTRTQVVSFESKAQEAQHRSRRKLMRKLP